MTDDLLRIRGARVHNLRAVDLDIPHRKLIVFTGVSGSGKTSMGVHTIHAEGRRRYVASLSTHARAVAETLPQPDVDWMGGLNPTLAIAQHAIVGRTRSTVGTLTEIHDHLRGLFARFGRARCPSCGETGSAFTVEEAADAVLSWPTETRVLVLAPLHPVPSTARQEQLAELLGQGFVRARVAGDVLDLSPDVQVPDAEDASVELVVDRWIVRPDDRARLIDSLETARRHGDGVSIVHRVDTQEDHDFAARPTCGGCRSTLPALEPALFSFNQPAGMCLACEGLGELDSSLCDACEGTRLCPEASRVVWRGWSLPQLAAMELGAMGDALRSCLEAEDVQPIERETLTELEERLDVVERLGLSYLASERGAHTLSAGELRRLRLAGHVASTLTGITYILDEPTAGLHPQDTRRLVDVLVGLRDQGNTVLAIEHASQVIEAADHLVDFGPGAGEDGGRVVAQGSPSDLASAEASVTGAYLAGRRKVGKPGRGRRGASRLILTDATGHNLTGVDLEVPVGAFTVVTGVSGAGKTSLVSGTLAPAVARSLGNEGSIPLPFGALEGTEVFEQVVPIDGRPLGRNNRSNPATVTRIFDPIRRIFASTTDARVQGYDASRFSFNAAGGRCEVCDGVGELETAAHLLTDLRVPCHGCKGARYNGATLRVRYKGANIADVLDMSVDDALGFFEHHPRIHRVLAVLHDVGLGYLPLGRSATTLSGGESQRIKLAKELGRARRGARLLVMDEPDAGLHDADVERLASVIDRLVESGDTVVAVAHRPGLVWAADHVVDLGPGPGKQGGRVVVAGAPSDIAAHPTSATGAALAGMG